MKEFWDQKYNTKEYLYGTTPNQFLEQKLNELPVGEILFPAEGEGRNAVHASKLGWKVSAFDQSDEGRKKAIELAKANNVSIDYSILQIEDFLCDSPVYDVVGLFYCHLPSCLRRHFHEQVKKSLKTGGVVLLEGFDKAQLERNTGGPKNEDMLFSIDDILDDFKDFEIVEKSKSLQYLSEGTGHSGEAAIIRLHAKKK